MRSQLLESRSVMPKPSAAAYKPSEQLVPSERVGVNNAGQHDIGDQRTCPGIQAFFRLPATE